MKNKKVIVTIMILAILVCTCSFSAYADASDNSVVNKEPVVLRTANFKTMTTDKGIEVTFDLLQEAFEQSSDDIQNRSIGWVIVGYGQLRMVLFSGNGCGDFYWQFELTNGELIKSVRGTLVCEENNFLFDTNYAKEYVRESYDTNSLYARASGSIRFDFPNEPLDKNIRFKWANFYISSPQSTYSVTDGSVTGTVSDFS